MEIKTSYFAKMKKYAGNGVGIAICKYPPKGYRGIVYDKLAPTYEMIQGMKNPNTRDFYRREGCNTFVLREIVRFLS